MALWSGSSNKSFDLPVRPWALTLLNPTSEDHLSLESKKEYTDRLYTPNNVFRLHWPPRIDFLPHKGQYLT